jgi:co-chaperonin GroES (HSP10)
MSGSFVRAALPIALLASVFALAGCGGGDSEPEVVTVTETVTDTESTDTGFTDTTSTDTTSTEGTIYALGETATWEDEEFVVSDVETADEEPVEDLDGSKSEAEGKWVIFKVTTPEDEDSAFWEIGDGPTFSILGGDGEYYDLEYSDVQLRKISGQDGGEFLVWLDVPEEALSGADAIVSRSFGFSDAPDPAEAITRVDLGL